MGCAELESIFCVTMINYNHYSPPKCLCKTCWYRGCCAAIDPGCCGCIKLTRLSGWEIPCLLKLMLMLFLTSISLSSSLLSSSSNSCSSIWIFVFYFESDTKSFKIWLFLKSCIPLFGRGAEFIIPKSKLMKIHFSIVWPTEMLEVVIYVILFLMYRVAFYHNLFINWWK